MSDDTTPATPATPTWYDALGVPRDATSDQIKAAWRDATDRFEPGSGGQFKMFNEAAAVLLDPDARCRYDATLPPEAPVGERTEPIEPVAAHEPPPAAHEPPPPPPAAPVEESPEPAGTGRRGFLVRTLGGLGVLTLGILGVLTLAALVIAVVLGVKVHQEAGVVTARDEAPAAAERAAKVMLSYDYRTLPADRERAGGYLTSGFKKTYLKNFALLEKQKDGTPGAAVQTKTTVTSSVLGSGVMDAEDDAARVLVFVNQVSKRPGADPQIFQNRVAMKMEKVGDRWLVANLKRY
ncbi:MAG: DnaJ domain-containing protein [Marmoricola sp.]